MDRLKERSGMDRLKERPGMDRLKERSGMDRLKERSGMGKGLPRQSTEHWNCLKRQRFPSAQKTSRTEIS